MTEFSKRVLQMLGRVVLTTACQLFGRSDTKTPGIRITETRKTNRNRKQP